MSESPTEPLRGHIRPGQIYESCQPTFVVDGKPIHTRIRVTCYRPGDQRARVVDAVTGKRPRWIQVAALHASRKWGARTRSTGYYLAQDAPQETPDA